MFRRRFLRIAAATLLISLCLPGNALERVGHPALIRRPRPSSPTALPPPASTAVAPPESSAAGPPQCADPRGVQQGLRARRLLPTGAIDSTWSPAEGALCLTALAGLNRNVLAEPSGGAVVAWVDSRRGEPDIYLQRLTSAAGPAQGWPAGGLPVCDAEHSQYQLDVTADGTGGTYLAWQDYRSHRLGQVFLQHLAADGAPAPGWDAGGKAITDTLLEQSAPRLALAPDGGVFAVWQGRHEARLGLYVQHFESGGHRATGWPANGRAIDQGPVDNLSAVTAMPSGTCSLQNPAVDASVE